MAVKAPCGGLGRLAEFFREGLSHMIRIVHTGIDRRTLLKSSAAALATGIAMPAIAQTRPIKLGYVSPQTCPLAAFAEADNFVIANFKYTTQDAIKLGNATLSVAG